MRYGIGTAAAWLLLVLGAANVAAQSTAATDRVHHGVGAGEVTATTAVVWARCNHAGVLTVRAKAESAKGESVGRVAVTRARDFTGRVQLDGLRPETLYEYEAICGDFEARRAGGERLGRFRTAPPDDAPRAVRLAWSGDLGGQNVCRDAKEGYAIFDVIRDSKPDFFIALGDMIYADSPCRAAGRYGNEQVPGLLAPATKLEDALVRDDRFGVDFLLAQEASSDPARLFGSPAMAGLLTQLRSRYDVILCDSPPILALTDTVPLVPLVDRVLFVTALSFDLVWGYAGIMSFGQAVFFGTAGYGVALIARDLGVTSILLVLPAGLLIGLAFALLLGGFLLLGRHPASVIFVSLGTLTGSYAADRVARGWYYLGGQNGIPSIPPMSRSRRRSSPERRSPTTNTAPPQASSSGANLDPPKRARAPQPPGSIRANNASVGRTR